jgi:hypothetical protein
MVKLVLYLCDRSLAFSLGQWLAWLALASLLRNFSKHYHRIAPTAEWQERESRLGSPVADELSRMQQAIKHELDHSVNWTSIEV